MTFFDLTLIFFIAAKKLNFYDEKRVYIFAKIRKFRFLLKMRHFFSVFPS